MSCVLLRLLMGLVMTAAANAVFARAESIRCVGVLGNSGEQGESLVSWGEQPAAGLGVAVDRDGGIWSRAGAGLLNRYAPDGRRLASYRIPGGSGQRDVDAIAIAGDTVFLRLDKGLHALAVDAPDGSEARSLGIKATLMSLGSWDGRVLAAEGRKLFLVAADGQIESVTELPAPPSRALGFGPGGGLFASVDWRLCRIDKGGAAVPVGDLPGERVQYLAGHWFGHGWHSTIRRADADLRPAPGVVLGGNSGAFLGRVAEQAEVVNGRGLAEVRPGLFAVAGLDGVVHLLRWEPATQRFEVTRRIGAVPLCQGLALDDRGRVWWRAGTWNPGDGPTSPLRDGCGDLDGMQALALAANGTLVGFGAMYGKPGVFRGGLGKDLRHQPVAIPADTLSAAAAVAIDERPLDRPQDRRLLVVAADGRAVSIPLSGDGQPRGDVRPLVLEFAQKVAQLTSLAWAADGRLLAGADGAVIELVREGDGWREADRWRAWGSAAADAFGPSLSLATDGERLWVADSGRHRVICLDLASRKLLGTYGAVDEPGQDLTRCDRPGHIAARDGQAVVHDRGNRRLLRLELPAAGPPHR
jgi:hypothetical protein